MYSIRKLYYNILYYITVLLYVISTNQGAAQFWQNMRDRVQAWRKSHQDQTDVEEDVSITLTSVESVDMFSVDL